MNIAIIPARAGSKRLPGKNIKLLAGKPMIAWTIEAALDSKVFDHVFVSTDGEEIAQISKEYGAEVPFLRPAEISSDHATTNDLVTHLVAWFEKEHGKEVKRVTILQPTSPLRTAEHIREAAELMKTKSAKAIVSVCKLEYPIAHCNQLGPNCSMDGFINNSLIRTQDYEPEYRINGAIYMFDRSYVSEMSEIYSQGTYAYIMSSSSSVDIDVADDFSIAEYYMRNT